MAAKSCLGFYSIGTPGCVIRLSASFGSCSFPAVVITFSVNPVAASGQYALSYQSTIRSPTDLVHLRVSLKGFILSGTGGWNDSSIDNDGLVEHQADLPQFIVNQCQYLLTGMMFLQKIGNTEAVYLQYRPMGPAHSCDREIGIYGRFSFGDGVFETPAYGSSSRLTH